MSAVANQTPQSTSSDYATTAFIVLQLLSAQATSMPVRVMKCTNAGGLAPVGRVDVQLLVDMILENGETVPHGTVYDVPYSRLQGGSNAVIIDPEAGDLGVCLFAMRDISAVKANPTAARDRQPSAGAPPGSRRKCDFADAMYVGAVLNGVPTQYVQFNANGITVHSPVRVLVTAPSIDLQATTEITLQAPTINLKGEVVQTDGNVSMSDDLHVAGTTTSDADVVSGAISLRNHRTSAVTPGGGTSGPPVP